MASRERRRRRWIGGAVLLAVAAAGAIVAGPRLLPGILARGLVAWARARGVGPLALRVERVGWRHAEIADLRLGTNGELGIERLAVDYTPRGILDGRVERIIARDVTVRAVLGGEGTPVLPRAGTPPAVPFETLVVRGLHLEIVAADGARRVTVRGSVEVRAEPDRLHLRADLPAVVPASDLPFAAVADLALAGEQVSGRAHVRSADGRLRARLVLDPEQARPAAGLRAAGRLEVRVRHLGPPPASLAVAGHATLDFAAADGGVRGRLAVRAGADGSPGPDLAVRGAVLGLAGDLVYDDGRLTLAARDGSLRVAHLAYAGVAALAAPLDVRLAPTDAPLLALAPGGDLRVEAALAPAAFRATARALRGPLEGETPALHVTVEPRRTSVTARGGAVRLPAEALAFEGVDVDLGWEGGRADAGAVVHALRSLHDPPLVRPLRLEGHLTLGDGNVAFDARASDPDGVLAVAADGTHVLASGQGRARLRLSPLRFGQDGARATHLFPALRHRVRAATGAVAASGTLSWSAAGIRSALDVTLDHLGIDTGTVRADGIAGTVHVDGPWPPSTPPGQRLTVARLAAGMELRQGTVLFQLHPDGRLALEEMEWHALGGTLSTSGVVDPGAAAQRLVLHVQGLDLAALVATLEVQGLSVDGTVQGDVPVEIEASRILLQHGHLAAAATRGTIRYRPTPVPPALAGAGAGADLMLEALRDFQYDALDLMIDGEAMGEVKLVLHLRGANPDFYDGHPIELNVNLSGPLGAVASGGLGTVDVPALIERHRRERDGSDR